MVSGAGVSALVAERQQKAATARTRRWLALLGKRMFLGIVAVALASVFSWGGEYVRSLELVGVHMCSQQYLTPS